MDPRDIDLPTLTSLAGNGVVRRLLADLAGEGFAGVRVPHGYVFQRLVDAEPTITELAESLGMTQQGASKQVRDLEQLGFVERRPVPGDGRARSVRLDRKRGAGSWRQVDGRVRRWRRRAVERVGARDVRAAEEVLGRALRPDRPRMRTCCRRAPGPPAGS